MKTLIAFALSLGHVPSAFAYEVTIKKGLITVDGVEELTWSGCDPHMAGSVCLVNELSVITPEGAVNATNAHKFGRMYDTIPDRAVITIIVQ